MPDTVANTKSVLTNINSDMSGDFFRLLASIRHLTYLDKFDKTVNRMSSSERVRHCVVVKYC
jgi:hypothetical protein